ncbi:MAG: hypothetical protein AB7V55_00175 [Oscillospiraceae bacterium]
MEKQRFGRTALLFVFCYAAALLLLFGVHLGGFVANRLAYRSGALAPGQLALHDFTWQDMEEKDGRLVTTGGDPQLLLKDAGRRVENLVLELEFALPTKGITVFWAKPGMAHSLWAVAYPDENTGRVWLPAGGGQSLRIDPDSRPGNVVTVRQITVNQQRPFYAFFVPTAAEVAAVVVLPALAACLLQTVGVLLAGAKRAKAGGGQ